MAVGGLLLQLAGAVALLLLGFAIRSVATAQLGWLVLGGVPIWFVALLLFRQHELADLEQMDLEELRRERAATGGGEAIFGAGGGYAVAANRLEWMRRWFVPAFSLVVGAYLVIAGVGLWLTVSRGLMQWRELENVQVGILVLSVAMLLFFLLSRFAAGMGRIVQWQLLRAGASFMLGNALVALLLVAALGVQLYTGDMRWDRYLAFALPWVMIVIGVEVLANFVLDIYRPRLAGVEPRAAFDSRILALFSEPGGIAHSVAEALNYQFGFQVSQTWFYQLVQRAFVPLVGFGALALWVLTCIVVVQPYELAIIERFGRQLNADAPLGPGLHVKAPWPIDVAQKYNTKQLHQMWIGRKVDSDEPHADAADAKGVVLWSDPKHGGFEEFNFMVAPPPRTDRRPSVRTGEDARTDAETVAVHVLRMTVVLQYQILPERLREHTGTVATPQELLRALAWQELIRFNASSDSASLLGERRAVAADVLMERVNRRLAALDVGLQVIYVGFQDVHPETRVAEAWRRVIGAETEKVTEIRKALVAENRVLSAVAGDRDRAHALAAAIEALNQHEAARNQAETALAQVPAESLAPLAAQLDARGELFDAVAEAQGAVRRARIQLARRQEEVNHGLGASLAQRDRARQAVAEAEAAERAAIEARDAAFAGLRGAARLGAPAAVDALLAATQAQHGERYWNRRIEELLVGLEGEAAVTLANAHARRWELEMRAVTELALAEGARSSFRAAPDVYRARSYLRALTEGIRNSRKYLLGVDPNREVKTRIEAQEQARPGIEQMPTRAPE
ncbi:MAG: SPFH domain-containing protein [Phycisphaerae bacterium]